MTLSYLTEESFYDGIAELVKRGLTFEAQVHCLAIVLTGGF